MARGASAQTVNPTFGNEITQMAIDPLRITFILAEK
jgi:hypothetical protein